MSQHLCDNQLEPKEIMDFTLTALFTKAPKGLLLQC